MQKPFGPHIENICNKIRSTQMQITSDLFSLHQFGWAMTWESNWKFMGVANHRTTFIRSKSEHSYNCLRCFWLVSNCFQMSCKGSLCNLLSTQCTKCVHRNIQSCIVVHSKHKNARHNYSRFSAVQSEGKWLCETAGQMLESSFQTVYTKRVLH